MKSIYRLLPFVFVAVLLFSACRSEEEPSATFPKSDIQLTQQQNYANFEIKSNTSWTLQCFAVDENTQQLTSDEEKLWFIVTPSSGLGSQVAKLDVLSYNDGTEVRYGYIVIKSADKTVDTIVISQDPASSIEVYVTPDTINVPVTGKTDLSFTAYATSKSAVVTIEPNDVSSMFDIDQSRIHESVIIGNLNTKKYDFVVKANTDDAERTSFFNVRVQLGELFDTTIQVVVIQAASYKASIKANSSVFLSAVQNKAMLPVAIEGSSSGEAPSFEGIIPGACSEWIKTVTPSADKKFISITTTTNSGDLPREGYITLQATVGTDLLTSTVRVIQAGRNAPCVIPATSSVSADYKAQSLFLPYTLYKGASTSDVKAFSGYSWIKNIMIAENGLIFDIEENSSFSDSYREGVIYVVTSNATYGDAVVQVSVRQYSSLNVEQFIVPNSITVIPAADTMQLSLSELDGTLSVLSTSASWLTASITGSSLTITTTKISSTGDDLSTRDAYITFEYTKDGSTHTYDVLVRQLSGNAPAVDFPIVAFHNQEAGSTTFPLNLTAGATASVVSSPSWAPASISGGELKVDFTSFTSGSRESTIVVSCTVSGTTYFYSLRVMQIFE